MKQLNIFMAVVIILFVAAVCPSAYPLTQQEAPFINNVSITLVLEKMKNDDRGTDVSNIYNITVDYTDKVKRQRAYNVMFYLDGVYTDEFKNQTLPFTFAKNFKGQMDAAHEIRVDLENRDDLTIVGRQTAAINVAHIAK